MCRAVTGFMGGVVNVIKRCEHHYACVRYAVDGDDACEGCPRAGEEILIIDHPEECRCPWCLEIADKGDIKNEGLRADG